MLCHEAITLAMDGKKLTSETLPDGAIIKCDAEGELRVVFEATGSSYIFTPRAEHSDATDWREIGGWASYG